MQMTHLLNLQVYLERRCDLVDKVEIDVTPKGGSDYAKIAKDTGTITTNVRDTQKHLQSQMAVLKNLNKEFQTLNSQLIKIGLSQNQAFKQLQSGGPIAALNNAQTTGQIKKFEASLEQSMTRVINRFGRGLTDTIKAAENVKLLNLRNSGAYGGANSAEDIKRELLARKGSLASNELRYSALDNRYTKQKPALLAEINAERKAVQQLEERYKGLSIQQSVATQAQIVRARTASKELQAANRAATLERISGDGGAGLFQIQGQLLGNYLIMNKLFQLFNFGRNFVVELDKAFRDLQAITATTDTEMVSLKDTLIETSQATRFTAVEVTKAATILGQAGFSTAQIKDSIKDVTLFATAVGTNLEQAADLASSTISVFNLRAEEMGHVSNVLTGAINLSKLTVDKLALGIQYAGNAAFQSGATLEELVSVLGALANAGIRSGSTLGTGLRQILVELQDPSKKFREEMDKLGLTMGDIDVQSQGLIGVFENLRDAGFNSSTAFKSFETRAASAYIAIANNIDVANKLYATIGLTNAAAVANERQMQSLANVMDNLTSSVGTFIYKGSEPFIKSLVLMAKGLTTGLNFLNQFTGGVQILGSALTALGIAIIGLKLVNLTRGLLFGASAVSLMAAGLGPLTLGLTALTGVIIGVGYAFGTLSGAKAELDEATAAVAEAEGALASQQARIESVDEELNRLANRYVSLKGNNAALGAEVVTLQAKFGEFSDKLASGTISTIDDLIKAMSEVRGEFTKLSAEQAKFVQNAKQLQFSKIQENLREQGKPGAAEIFGGFGGFFDTRSVAYEASTFSKNNSKTLGSYNFNPYSATEKEINAFNLEINRMLQGTYGNIRKVKELLKDANYKDKANAERALETLQAEIAKLQNLKVSLDGLSVAENLQEVSAVAASGVASVISSQIENYKINLAKAKDAIDKEDDPEKKKQLGAKLGNLKVALDNFLLSIVDEKGDLFQKLLSETGNADAVKEFGGQINAVIAGLSTDYETKIDEVKENTDNYVKEQEKFFDGVSEVQKAAYERLKTSINNNLVTFDRKIKNIDNIIAQSTDLRRGALRGQYSDAEISMFQDQKVGVERTRLSQQLSNNQSLLPGADQSIASAEKYLQVAQAKYAADNKSSEAVRELTSAQRDLLAAQQEKFKLEQDILLIQDELAVSSGEMTIQNRSLGDQIGYVVQRYYEQKAIQNDIGLNIEANITRTLDNAETAFASFIETSVSGTKSVKDSFKDMATSIIQDMLKIASQKAASGILSSILGSVTGAFTKGATIYSTPAGPGFKRGGFIHRAGGGPMPGRDSVKALLEPGEYVLRKQAVDQIGRNNLDTVNALGRRALSQPGADIGALAANAGAPSVTNVWVVAPEEKPALTKGDIIVTISEDIIKGGTTKKLIKQVINGA